jgi:hypothetical protein
MRFDFDHGLLVDRASSEAPTTVDQGSRRSSPLSVSLRGGRIAALTADRLLLATPMTAVTQEQ